jgi:hypothetical protein
MTTQQSEIPTYRWSAPWQEFFQTVILAKTNLVFLGASQQRRIGELALVVLTMLKGPDDRPAFSQVAVLLPPDLPDTIIEELHAAALGFRGYGLNDDEQRILSLRLTVLRVSSLDRPRLIKKVQEASEKTFIVIVNGAHYRASDDPAQRAILTAEDQWTQPLVRLTAECNEVLPQASCILVDTGVFLPKLVKNRKILQDKDDCTLWGAESKRPIDERFLARQRKWIELVRQGRSHMVLPEIEVLEEFTAADRLALAIQVLHQGDDSEQAIAFLRRYLDSGFDPSPEQYLQLAEVAASAKESKLCADLLVRCVEHLQHQLLLERAARLSGLIESPDVEKICVARLRALYPDSSGLTDHRLKRLIRACGRLEAYEVFDPNPLPFDNFAHFVADAMRHNEIPDYSALLRDVEARWPEWFTTAAAAGATNAYARGLPMHALQQSVLVGSDTPLARRSAKILLWCLERLILGRNPESEEYLSTAVVWTLKYLAREPSDTQIRERLDELTSIDVSGRLGGVVLAHALLRLRPAELKVEDISEPIDSRFNEELFSEFLRSSFEWLNDLGAVDLSTVSIPSELLPYSAPLTLQHIENLVQHIIRQDEGDDAEFLRIIVPLTFAVGSHIPNGVGDLVILRSATSRLSLIGETQTARDFVEGGLRTTRGNPERARLAWHAYADVFNRAGNASKALLALGCAAATEARIDAAQAYYEAMGVVRALRDMNLTPFAYGVLSRCRALLKAMNADRSMMHRLDTVRLGLIFRELAAERSDDVEAWSRLLGELTANLKLIIKADDELMPVLVLCTQAHQLCRSLGIQVEAEDEERVREAAAKLGVVSSGLFRIAANEVPDAEYLFDLAKALQSVRYSEDIGFDVQWMTRAARAFLAEDANLSSPPIVAFAAELLADHGVKGISSDDAPRLPNEIEAPGRVLDMITADGVAVEMLVFDANDVVVRLKVNNGDTTVNREADCFSIERMNVWSLTFPYGFGLDENNRDPNLFYSGMRGLELSGDTGSPCVFVYDTKLNRVPPQLLLAEGDFLGRKVATAVIPSLTWLGDALGVANRHHESPYAWISTDSRREDDRTLFTVAERLADTLQEHGIPLDTGATLPAALRQAELAIVAAHGGLTEDKTFFQVVSDEASLQMSALDMARALEGAGVVVLFVCSGGRQTEHPIASTTVGLPKQLLDRGCSVVIASPWPLDSRVPSHWLPTFLSRWVNGDRLIDANYAANLAVSKAMGDSPRDTMAMTLYGNPLLRRPRR